MYAMIATQAPNCLQPSGSPTLLIERESIRKAILPISAASYRQTHMQDLMSYIVKTELPAR